MALFADVLSIVNGKKDVDGLKPSKFLIETAKRNIEGEITVSSP